MVQRPSWSVIPFQLLKVGGSGHDVTVSPFPPTRFSLFTENCNQLLTIAWRLRLSFIYTGYRSHSLYSHSRPSRHIHCPVIVSLFRYFSTLTFSLRFSSTVARPTDPPDLPIVVFLQSKASNNKIRQKYQKPAVSVRR